jgi:hypothetical protein
MERLVERVPEKFVQAKRASLISSNPAFERAADLI